MWLVAFFFIPILKLHFPPFNIFCTISTLGGYLGVGVGPATKRSLADPQRIGAKQKVPKGLDDRQEETRFRALIPIRTPEEMEAMNNFLEVYNIAFVSFS